MFASLTMTRRSRLVGAVGLAAFVAAFGLLTLFAPSLASTILPTLSETLLTAILAAILAQLAMSITGALLTRRQSVEIEQMRRAIDSMPQGLCMFDASERLVVCNTQ